jgi:hypothetical protein
MRPLLERPRQPDLRGAHAVRTGHGEYGARAVRVGRAGFASLAGDREEGDERDALLPTGSQDIVAEAPRVDAVPILHADHRRDGPRLVELFDTHIGNAQVPDEPGLAQPGQHTEVLGYRTLAGAAQVHHIEVVEAELAQVLLHLPAQLVGRRPGQPLTRRAPAGADLGGDDQVVRVRRQRPVDQLVRRAQRREVERGGVDVVHTELDRAPQHTDRLVAVAARRRRIEDTAAGEAHRPETEPVHGQIAEFPCARGRRGDRL